MESRFAKARIIYFAQAVSILMIAAVGWFLLPIGGTFAGRESVLPIWALVLFLAVTAIVARRFLVKWERLHNVTVLKGIDGLLATLQANVIILGAIAEAIIIGGVAAAFLGGDRGDIMRAMLIAAIVLLVNFPRISTWETIVSSLKDAAR